MAKKRNKAKERSKKPTKLVDDLPLKRLTAEQAKAVKGGVTTSNNLNLKIEGLD